MCGRYVLAKDYEELKARFGLTHSDFSMKPRYNIAPQQENPVIVRGSRTSTPLSVTGREPTINGGAPRELDVMQWGLIPHWAKDPKIGYKMINARAETVHEKPSFREPFKKQRCLVPANGFYEWPEDPRNPKKKVPLYIHLKSDELFAFAGIWSIWSEGEKLKKTYSLITTEPNEMLSKYHDRMPVILSRDEEDKWLDPKTDINDLKKLLDSYPAKEMEAYYVSTMVNKPVNDSPENLKPVKVI